VTPNKKANSEPLHQYEKLQKIAAKKGVKFLYGSNVGGLPIISTIQELIQCGEKIHKIEATLSRTLSYLFNTFNTKGTFSERVQEAQMKGYTEPDPREDLNGFDVMRKLLILIRETGVKMEMDDIDIQRILPEDCFQASWLENFTLVLKITMIS
jgi:aspartokinase/homoserine dehydrogenase 1